MDEMAGVIFAIIFSEKALTRHFAGATIVDGMTTMVGCNFVWPQPIELTRIGFESTSWAST
jgi:hypothetical protein